MVPGQVAVEAEQTLLTVIREGLGWRVRALLSSVYGLLGASETQWARVVMNRETERFVRSLKYSSLNALEISGTKWECFGFAAYRTASFPEYDVCGGPLEVEAFDIIIAEQVLEHVLWPYRAVRNIWKMLRPSGVFVVTTPFLLRVHNSPADCSRWTEMGLKHLLAECGFELDRIITGSWGNRSCVRANFREWRLWIPWMHSLRNEGEFPVVVWALARKDVSPYGEDHETGPSDPREQRERVG